MEIPAGVESEIDAAVVRHLGSELGKRGLLQAAQALAAADAEVAQRGARLLRRVMNVCYPVSRRDGRALTFEFGSAGDAARLGKALAFGAVTARLLATRRRDSEQAPGSVALLCAMFNLGIGLIDGLCDGDAETGVGLLELMAGEDLATAAEEPRVRSWLRAASPPVLVEDPTAAFAIDVVEAFFETLHVVYPGDGWLTLRRRVAGQVGEALDAERRSVVRLADRIPREQLIDCSRLTSVLPFQIVETLACGELSRSEPTAGTKLGEAMWRIDDLVDLCDDARSGSLNGILLAAATSEERPNERDRLAALERLLASMDIASVAGDAADNLLDGLQLAGGECENSTNHLRSARFLFFIQRYAGIGPDAAS